MKKSNSKPLKKPFHNPITALIIQQNPKYVEQENYLKALYHVIFIKASKHSTLKMSIVHNNQTMQPNLKITIIGGLIREGGEQSLLRDISSITIDPETSISEIQHWYHADTEQTL